MQEQNCINPLDQKSIVDTIKSDETILNIFKADVINQVSETINKREERRLKYISIFISLLLILSSLLVFFGYSSIISTIENNIGKAIEKIDPSINKKINSNVSTSIKEYFTKIEFDKTMADVNKMIMFFNTLKAERILAKLSEIANYLDNNSRFSVEMKNSAMELLKEYHEMQGKLSRDFLEALAKILDSFDGSDNNHLVDDIYTLWCRYFKFKNYM